MTYFDAEVEILLATYNGSKYIEEQIRSLINQSYTNWKLLIHDDGSQDDTVNIIKQLRDEDSRIVLIEDGLARLGVARNFLHLLNHTTAPYIMFCDQDDIWFTDKVSSMLDCIKGKSGSSLVFSDAESFDGTNIISKSISITKATNLQNTLFLNGGIHGCTMIINRLFKEGLTPYPEYFCMHDHLITLYAVCFGNISFLNRPLMFYRQHGSNVSGIYEANYKKRITRFFKFNQFVTQGFIHHSIRSFYDTYQNRLNPTQKQQFNAFFKYTGGATLLQRMLLVIKYRFKIGNSMAVLLLKTILRKPLNNANSILK